MTRKRFRTLQDFSTTISESFLFFAVISLVLISSMTTSVPALDISKEEYAGSSSKAGACLWRSALVPGWGQLHAGSQIKGILFLATTVALAYAHTTSTNYSSTKRRELNRWSILFWLYNLGDAYVDGYLAGFDEEMESIESIGDDILDEGQNAELELGFSISW